MSGKTLFVALYHHTCNGADRHATRRPSKLNQQPVASHNNGDLLSRTRDVLKIAIGGTVPLTDVASLGWSTHTSTCGLAPGENSCEA